MTRIELKSRVGPDGVLSLRVPIGAADADREVIVTVEPVNGAEAPRDLDREEWLGFIDETAGSIDDPTFERPPQGEYEQREELD
jgi:hypothetical protein